MKSVLTLICNPAEPILTIPFVSERVQAAWKSAGPSASVGLSVKTLAEGVAVDIHLIAQGSDAQTMRRAIEPVVRNAFADAPVDVVWQATEDREKRLLIADMDSTMIEQECIDELADFAGLRAEISAITERAMRGELDFEAALKERVRMLKGLDLAVLQRAFDERISFTPGGRTLVQTMNARGAVTALVSGGFTFFTSRVAQALGFQHEKANTLLDDGRTLSGEVAEPVLGREAKEAALVRLSEAHGAPLEATLAVGDGANDLAMIGRAGLGVAFRAKPAVAEAADARIDHADLTALLYLQGLPREAFVEG